MASGPTLALKVRHGSLSKWLSSKETIPPAKCRRRRSDPSLKPQAFCFTLILLSSLTLSIFIPVSVAQTQDYSRVNLPDGAIVRLGKGGVSYRDRGIAFSPDGTKLAIGTGTGNNTVKLWDVSTQKHIASFPGHTGWVRAVAFSPDGTKLASGSFDGTVLLWDVPKSIKLYPSKQHSDRWKQIHFFPLADRCCSLYLR